MNTVIVFTENSDFYCAISLALQDRYLVRLSTALEHAAELASIGLCHILITDAARNPEELGRITDRLKAINSDLITIAAGDSAASTLLRPLFGTERLQGFLQLPLKATVVRLCVEVALRRSGIAGIDTHESKPDTADELFLSGETETSSNKRLPIPYSQSPFFRGNSPPRPSASSNTATQFLTVGSAVLLLAAGSMFLYQRYSTNETFKKAVREELTRAQTAYDEGRYFAPDGAAFHYKQALALAPENDAAQTGLDNTVSRVIEQAERALVQSDLDAAADSIGIAKLLAPDNTLLPFLEIQLTRERRLQLQQAETSAALARDTSDAKRTDLINQLLSDAQQRIAANKLVTPEGDSALFYLNQLQSYEPNHPDLPLALGAVRDRLMTQIRKALSDGQLTVAKRRIDDALLFGPADEELETIRQEVKTVTRDTTLDKHLRLALDRIHDNFLFSPVDDCANFHVAKLIKLDASSAEARQATKALQQKIVESANAAIADGHKDTALDLIAAATVNGLINEDLTEVESRVRLASNATRPPVTHTLQPPQPIATTAPQFPTEALQAGVQGWVDVGFKINPMGEVFDASPIASFPSGRYAEQFERAAVESIEKYKYDPRASQDMQTMAMVVRVTFALQQ